MNINDFENYISATIVDRGFSYYIEGNVVEVKAKGENEYILQIEGSDDYEVFVEIAENGDIIYSECDCPYDFGPVCKHEVAAYYQLIEVLRQGANPSKKPLKRATIQEVLSNLSNEELINIIVNIANNDSTIEKSLIVKYSNVDNQQDLQSCKKLIDAIVRKYTGREGFIKYRETGAFVSELEDIVEKARNTRDVLHALDIALLLLEEAIGAFQYADDSDGSIGSLVSESLELVADIATRENALEPQRTEMFEKLIAQTDKDFFDGWSEYKIDLLKICFEFADNNILRERLRIKIESMLDTKLSDRYTHYSNESLLQLLFHLLDQYGTQEEAHQFILEHLQFSSFREQLLNKYLEEQNYQKVIEVAEGGETQDHYYPGLVFRWKKFRYIAYKHLSLKEEQCNLAKELLLSGKFEYYRDLKELTLESQDEFSFYENLKSELKTVKSHYSTHMFLKLIEEENDLKEMLKFVQDNPSYIENYAQRLVKDFNQEIIEVYKIYIKTTASTASNRKHYQGVCHKIKKYKKIVGESIIEELINELMGLYKNRPAFIDELGKVK